MRKSIELLPPHSQPSYRCARTRHSVSAQTVPIRADMSYSKCSEPLLLLRELTHRVCNEYSAAISCVDLAAARATTAEAKVALTKAADRLYDYASVHRALQMPVNCDGVDLSDYLRQLCQALGRSRLLDAGIGLTLVEKGAVVLCSEQCWHTGLIVFELVTNAAKHAFQQRGGSISIEVACKGDWVLCRVIDDGAASKQFAPGHGTHIVDALARRLDGSVTRHVSRRGTTVMLTFPRSGATHQSDGLRADTEGRHA